MNEIIDKLILRIFMTILIVLILYIYKFIHLGIYPESKQGLFKNFSPSYNSANTIHFFSRILGIGIIFSGLYFNLTIGPLYSLLAFIIQSLTCIILFLVSIFILESICLYNFEYKDEIIKRKNFSYAIIDFSIVLSSAILLKTVIRSSNNSTTSLLFTWMFSIVIFGMTAKFYKFFSNYQFNRLLLNKNMALSLSFMGYVFGWLMILISAFNMKFSTIEYYVLYSILKILLASIIFPLFKTGMVFIYRLQDKDSNLTDQSDDFFSPALGHGIFEGTLFLTSCYLSTIVTGHIIFGPFYPKF